ncbi:MULTISPECIES: serine/threonine-protein kinase [unclassified Frankia]|uniref:serine/threonine-protein kinase n=1 Tax=unclassified Frankia TaxID=2632575 RepID=UPI002AD53CB4|nr:MULTISPECIES: serine/threonine-protein kinase [unclassified Frankia]
MAVAPEASRIVASRYRLIERLGTGGMGTVWRAFDEVLLTEAALKEVDLGGDLDPFERADRVERALREARHAARLRGHPHVVTILDVVVEDGLPWIVMELVPSQSLFQLVRDHGPLPVAEVARIGIGIGDALSAAHAFGILHRDVKPSNVLIGTGGRVVLTDFGIATRDSDSALTVTGVLGTPSYMSPERLNGDLATPEADLFGLGATLYFAVEGKPPFYRETFAAMVAAILFQPPSPTDRAGPLADVLAGLLDKDPRTRLTSRQTRGLLIDIATARPPVGAPPPAGDPARPSGHPRIISRDNIGPHYAFDRAPENAAPGNAAPGNAAPGLPATARDFRAIPADPADRPVDRPVDRPADERDVLAPPSNLTATQEDGAVVLRWSPPESSGPVSFRVLRVVADPAAPGGRFERSLGTTGSTELSDAGVPHGVTLWHEVMSAAAGRRSAPARTPPLMIAPEVTELRARMDGDGVALSWTLTAGYDDVLVERAFDESSSFHGATRRVRAAGGGHVDRDVQTGATYRYRVRVSYPDPLGALAHTAGVDVVLKVIARPRPVLDLEADSDGAMTTLRWTTVPGALVRIYATEASADLSEHPLNQPPDGDLCATDPFLATGPFGPVDQELPADSLDGREHLVGSSRRGRLTVTAAGRPVVYTPVSIAGNRAVLGRSTHHLPVEGIHGLQAVDRGNKIVLTFQMPPGITEARVLWRHDTMPTGPDDPAAQSAKVTNASLEIRGGWHLGAPEPGLTYHFAVYPLIRSAGGVRALPTGAHVVARAGSR